MKNNLQIVFSTPDELALLEKFKKKVKAQGGKMATTIKVLIKRLVEDKITAYYKLDGSTLKVCTEKKSDDWIEFYIPIKSKDEQKSP